MKTSPSVVAAPAARLIPLPPDVYLWSYPTISVTRQCASDVQSEGSHVADADPYFCIPIPIPRLLHSQTGLEPESPTIVIVLWGIVLAGS